MQSCDEVSWWRLDAESARQFELFSFYLHLKPHERSYAKVAKKFGVSGTYIERTAASFHWQSRVRAHQNAFAAQADEVKAEAIKDVALDWVDWELENLDRARVITEGILARCEAILAAPFEEITDRTKPALDSKTGKVIKDSSGAVVYQNISITKPVKFTASDAPRYAEAAIILTKFLSEFHRPPLRSSLPAPSKPIEEMTIEERAEYIEKLRELQRKQVSGEAVIDLGDEGEQ